MNKLSFSVAAILMVSANLSCSPKAETQTIKPYFPQETIVEDNVQSYEPNVDILFVIDNSGSMDGHQNNLARNIPLFTGSLSRNSFLDFNIGVVTSDENNDGKLVGSTRVVNKNTPNFDQVLAANLRVGTSGSYLEQMFGPTETALSPALLNGWNQGFYRQNAALAVVFITDAEDQSDISASQLYSSLLQLKNGDPKMVLAYGVVVPTSNTDPDCRRDSYTEPPLRIEQFLAMVDNGSAQQNVMHLCSPDFGVKLAEVSKDIAARVGKVIYLNRLPDIKSIRVMYGTTQIPADPDRGWSFDSSLNAIILGDNIDLSSQPHGTRLKVYFNAAQSPH